MSSLLETLKIATGMSEWDIRSIVMSAPRRYKSYTIAKRSGGERWISQPAREVKILQRALVEHVIERLPIHDAATAYRSKMSIRHNAEAHAKNGPILKYDFSNFFPSIRDHDWQRYCRVNRVFDDAEDIHMSTQLLFYRQPSMPGLRLAIGAPSSPMVSNVLMHDFDARLTESLRADRVVYTRYADDLTFSARRTGYLTVVDKILRQVIKDIEAPSLRLNEDKTVAATKKYRRFVTGLVLTNDGKVSLGHERKKRIRAAVYRFQQGDLSTDQTQKLSGMLAFAKSVEPEFLERLVAKYGSALIDEIKAFGFRARGE